MLLFKLDFIRNFKNEQIMRLIIIAILIFILSLTFWVIKTKYDKTHFTKDYLNKEFDSELKFHLENKYWVRTRFRNESLKPTIILFEGFEKTPTNGGKLFFYEPNKENEKSSGDVYNDYLPDVPAIEENKETEKGRWMNLSYWFMKDDMIFKTMALEDLTCDFYYKIKILPDSINQTNTFYRMALLNQNNIEIDQLISLKK